MTVELRAPVLPYRLLVFDEEYRMQVHRFETEHELAKAAADVRPTCTALMCTVDYLVNGGDEGGLREEHLHEPPPKRKPRPKRSTRRL